MTTSTTTQGAAATPVRAAQLLLAGFLGVFILGFVGFSHMDVAHNAAHDYRHSMAFPCH